MAAVIIAVQKRAPEKITNDFFEIVDNYVTSQDFIMIDDLPRIYFTEKSINPTKIKGVIETIRNTDDYSKVINKMYYTTNLSKT